MNDLKKIFERQAVWQYSRSKLAWAAKLRLSIIMRESLLAMRRSYNAGTDNTGCRTAENRNEA